MLHVIRDEFAASGIVFETDAFAILSQCFGYFLGFKPLRSLKVPRPSFSATQYPAPAFVPIYIYFVLSLNGSLCIVFAHAIAY